MNASHHLSVIGVRADKGAEAEHTAVGHDLADCACASNILLAVLLRKTEIGTEPVPKVVTV